MRLSGVISVVVLGLMCVGCAPITTQFRMADPVVSVSEGSRPAYIAFERYSGKSHRGKYAQESVIALKPAQVRKTGFRKYDEAFVMWDSPGSEAWDNRVNLKRNSIYRLSLCLPANYEQQRVELLNAKAETLFAAIEEGEAKLREINSGSLELLSETARAKVIADAQTFYDLIDGLQVDLVSTDDPAAQAQFRAQIQDLAKGIANREAMLAEDDHARDRMESLALEETLINQLDAWRGELAEIKQQIVALGLMVQNQNHPFPRVVNGWLETMDVTSFTKAGAVPFSIEDQYLDWIRQDKVVTVVFYDPNEKPSDASAAEYRKMLPLYWPEGQLTVIEHTNKPSGLPRDAHAGARARSQVDSKIYRGVRATTYHGEAGDERTYLTTPAGDANWVFAPDLAPPDNIEVWVEDERGVAVQKLYPSDARTTTQDVSVMQIAGVEGGVLDPIREARKRGQIIAVAYLGNWRYKGDEAIINGLYNKALKDAPEYVVYVDSDK